MPDVIAADVLAGFIRTAFVDTYKRLITDVDTRLSSVMEFGLPSDRSQEDYAYFDSAPHPRRWPRGEDIPMDAFEDVLFTIVNFDWARGVEWHRNDREDDQTQSLLQRAREVGTGFALLRERVFFQILLNATDGDLLPSVPLAPDGAAYFATTAAGSARFGVTDGNVVTGSGVTTADDVRSDFFDANERYHQMQDTKGQPLWPEALIDQGHTIIYNVQNDQVMQESLIQGRTLQVFSPGAGDDVAAAVTNVVLDSGKSLTLWKTQRISDNDWFVFLNGAPTKSVFEQVRQELEEEEQLPSNSDRARTTKKEAVMWNARYGFGLSLAYQAIQVNN